MIRTASLATAFLASALLSGGSASAAVTLNGRISQILNALQDNARFSPGNLSLTINQVGGPKTLFIGIQGVRNFKDLQALNDWVDSQPLTQSVFTNGSYKFTHSAIGSYFTQSGSSTGSSTSSSSSLFDGSPYKFTHSVLTSYFNSQDASSAYQLATAGPIDAPVPAAINQSVPEPATWAMMIGGFGLIGAIMRRRSSATHIA